MTKIQAVIFDWAGTTVDYGCFAPVNAFSLAFQAYGISPTIDEIRAPMGMLKRDHIRTMLAMDRLKEQWINIYGAKPDEAAVEKIYSVFEEALMQSLAEYSSPKPGTVEAVLQLREMGIAIGSTTGYTNSMMDIVVKNAAKQGYQPDAWFTPDAVDGMGRPYPYMIYANMQHFRIHSVDAVIKVGDTVADIREGKNAGVRSLGVLLGSSILGLSQSEYEVLPQSEQNALLDKARKIFLDAGADDVILDLGRLPAWLQTNNLV